MGSGFPLSGVLGKTRVLDIADVGSMSSTHSSNPIGCSAGSATLEVIKKEKLIKHIKTTFPRPLLILLSIPNILIKKIFIQYGVLGKNLMKN